MKLQAVEHLKGFRIVFSEYHISLKIESSHEYFPTMKSFPFFISQNQYIHKMEKLFEYLETF